MSYAKNPDTGSAEVLDRNDYYPFGMNSIGGFYSVYDVTGTPLNNKYNGKELQETGFYDYGWRQYMPDLGRWFGVDKLAESYLSTSPYAYVMNNPIMMYDPDGRSGNWWDNVWTNAGNNGTTTYTNFDSNGNWGSSTFTPFAQQGTATAFYNFLSSGQTGNFRYWTGGTGDKFTSYTVENGTRVYNGDPGTMHEIRIKGYDNNSTFGYDPIIGWGNSTATSLEGFFKGIASERTNLYNSGYWTDNLGNIRSIKYAGRAKGSLIGLRGDYLKTTAQYSKYAKGFGAFGHAVNAAKVGYGVYEDGGKFGHNAQVATAGVAGGMAGAAVGGWAGAKAGTAIGATIGVWFVGVGASRSRGWWFYRRYRRRNDRWILWRRICRKLS